MQGSILFNSVYVDEESVVESSLLFEGVRIGKGCRLRQCIIDKNVHVPDGTYIGYDRDFDRQNFHISDAGIVVIPKAYQFR